MSIEKAFVGPTHFKAIEDHTSAHASTEAEWTCGDLSSIACMSTLVAASSLELDTPMRTAHAHELTAVPAGKGPFSHFWSGETSCDRRLSVLTFSRSLFLLSFARAHVLCLSVCLCVSLSLSRAHTLAHSLSLARSLARTRAHRALSLALSPCERQRQSCRK